MKIDFIEVSIECHVGEPVSEILREAGVKDQTGSIIHTLSGTSYYVRESYDELWGKL